MVRVEDALFTLTNDELDGYPVGVITLDRAGVILHYNRAEAAFSGFSAGEVVGRRFFGDVAPCTAVREFEGRFLQFSAGSETACERFRFAFRFAWGLYNVEITMMRKAGRSDIHLLVETAPEADRAPSAPPGGAPLRTRGLGGAPPATTETLATLPTERLAMWSEDPHTGTTTWSPELRTLLRAPAAFSPDRDSLFGRVHPADRLAVRTAVERSAATARACAFECRLISFDRKVHHVLMHVGTHVYGLARYFGGTVIDQTARFVEMRRLRHVAEHDPLTGLNNMSHVRRRLETALADGRSTAVLFLDLDGFKRVNDAAGHIAGDALLCSVGARLRATAGDDAVARVSGDEFVIVLSDLDDDGVDAVVERILDAVAEACEIDGTTYFVTASIGIASNDAVEGDADALLDAADDAMYAAKARGKNAVLRYDPHFREAARTRESVDALIRSALVDDRVVVHFQPIVDVVADAIVGCEALVRIRRPDGRLAMPSEFIARAEETGLIIPLGERVLLTVVETMKAWEGTPLANLRVSINVSPAQFADRRFLPFALALFDESGIDRGRIELELTEGLMERFDDTLKALIDLKVGGVRVAIDDFGTGYSALGYLKYFPIDTLKLDRSFVSGIGHHPLDETIATTIVVLARELKYDVIAEGVETPVQRERLRALGVRTMQGFLFGSPMSPEAFAALVGAGIAEDQAPANQRSSNGRP
jgi:photoactive yellow protein